MIYSYIGQDYKIPYDGIRYQVYFNNRYVGKG